MLAHTFTSQHHTKYRYFMPIRKCSVCGAKAIGINFGALTCAPCKAFFRRNARRNEVLKLPCQHKGSTCLINDYPKDTNVCSQLRHCTSCRLRRCFEAGMKAELVRTEEEKLRYKQIIELNRQRRQASLTGSENKCIETSEIILVNQTLLKDKDWKLLSNIVDVYENYCLKNFIQIRQTIYQNQHKFSDQALSKISHHTAIYLNHIKSFVSFFMSVPMVKTLLTHDCYYLLRHNLHVLILLNSYEIEQTCFSEPWQVNIDDLSTEFVIGKKLFDDYVQVKKKAGSILINDPAVARLWLLTLCCSTPLYCCLDSSYPYISHKSRVMINTIQQSLTNLLWNYLLHQHGHVSAVRIFSNLTRICVDMQRISTAINDVIQTRKDLIGVNQAFHHAILYECEVNRNYK